MTAGEAVKLLRWKMCFRSDELEKVVAVIEQQAKALEEAEKRAEVAEREVDRLTRLYITSEDWP